MIAVCPNPFRDHGLVLTKQVLELLHRQGEETVVCPVFADDEPGILPGDVRTRPLHEVADFCRLAIVIGGDGTLLAVARQLFDLPVPVLGINLGTKGFMCALEPGDVDRIGELFQIEVPVSRRMMLEVEVLRNGETVLTDCALNDAVLHGYGDCIKLTAWCDSALVTSYSGDGIILSTPTGSTGYSMSAGGPIAEPNAENIIISPICAHRMGARSFVLAPERTVAVKAEKLHGRRAFLSVDGNATLELVNGDVVKVRRSDNCTLMADLGQKSFFEIAYEKLV